MLSPEERAGLLAEARDPRRREVLRRIRRERAEQQPPDLLAWLSAASEWLAPLVKVPRHRIGGDCFLL